MLYKTFCLNFVSCDFNLEVSQGLISDESNLPTNNNKKFATKMSQDIDLFLPFVCKYLDSQTLIATVGVSYVALGSFKLERNSDLS